jgi:beta-phosphoglucomutase-like phosphatase (HAD superfamily)
MVDAVLLELEGVLFDTQALRYASLREACAAHGIILSADDVIAGATVKTSVVAALSAAGQPGDHVLVDLMVLEAERAFSHRLSAAGVSLQPHTRPFLERATGKARLAVVTRARRDDAEVMLGLAGLNGIFSCVVTADDTFDPKPSAAGIQIALDRLGRRRTIVRGSAFALEDGIDGIRAARAAGIRCVAVGAIPPHIAMEADAFVPSLDHHTPATLDTLSLPGRERVQ